MVALSYRAGTGPAPTVSVPKNGGLILYKISSCSPAPRHALSI